jgi:hypothetical protein
MDMDLGAFNAKLTQLTIFWTAVEIAVFICVMFALYFVVKAAVRDGVRESGLLEALKRSAKLQNSDVAAKLPDMRAD